MHRLLVYVLFFFFSGSLAHATHIIGGFVDYQYLGSNQYEITLTVYRDCFGGQAPFDDPAAVAIYDGAGNQIRTLSLFSPTINTVQPNINNPCLVIPPQVCVQEAIYTTTVTLAPNASGYYFTYQRCCRNGSITNVPAPGTLGATYFTFIPDSTKVLNNSSPVFTEFPPIAICVNEPLIVDQSATDADGDSLVYSLCASFDGGSQGNPAPNPPAPPPYNKIPFANPYTPTNPIDANPALKIDSLTGLLTATPTTQGQYVVGICIDEYRNGVLIGTHVRDFQFNVLFCPDVAVIEPLPDTSVLCAPFEITFGNNSATNVTSYFWNFGDPTTTQDTSSLFEPTWTYPAEGTYTVTLFAENTDGCKDTSEQIVNIRQAVFAIIDYDTVCPGEPVRFFDSSTTDLGPFASWKWKFGDGDSSNLRNPVHTYAGTGPFTATLTVVTTDGCSVSSSKPIRFNPVPVANFSTDTRCVGLPILFTDQSTVAAPDTIAQWQWDFGDGTTENVQNPTHTYVQPGPYTVSLIVSSDEGCVDTISRTITIADKLIATVNNDTSVCFNQPVQLLAGGGQTYQWFPAAGVSNPTIANPIAQPQANTVYTVIVTDSCYTDTAFVSVSLLPAPIADFTADLACVGDTIRFLDASVDTFGQNIVAWDWAFGDGSIANSKNPLHIYNADGPFPVTLTITNDTGCVATVSKLIEPFSLPDVAFSIDTPPCLNLPTLFTDRTTSDTGIVVFRSWSFGDGAIAGNDSTTQHIYGIPGFYTIRLTATTDLGCTDSADRIIEIRTRTSATVNQPAPICPDDSAQLIAGGGLFYQWTPSTGLSSDTAAQPLASPNVTTTYTVIVSDSCYADTATVTLIVKPKPTAAFSFTDDCVNDTTFFTDLSTTLNSVLTDWRWDFGDGTTSQLQNPLRVYQANGAYNVQLIVTNDEQCSDTLLQTVTPYPVADTDFSFDTLACLGEPVQFTDNSVLVTGTITNWQWDFGDGSAGSNQQNPGHAYTLPGNYTVQLITTTNNSCLDTIEKVIVIEPDVTALVTGDTAICSLDVAQLTAVGGLYYSWEPADLVIGNADSAIVKVLPTQPTIFTVTVADDCSADTATISIDLLPWPDVVAAFDTLIYKGEVATLEALVGSSVNTFDWSPTGTIEPAFLPSEQRIEVRPDTIQWYTITVTDDNGCRNRDSALVNFLDPFIAVPNAFTPNGDQLNDIFYVITRGEIELIDFSVFNRWGQRIFRTQGLATAQNGWDGTLNGVEQPPASYTYLIKYRPVLVAGEVLVTSGNFTLIR